MRNAFLRQLSRCAAEDPRICLVVGDLGYSVVEPFRDQFGPRFLNAGVAEQNMSGLAAGMAMSGLKVFTYSIANFSTLRCLEQIRNDICYHGADVTVVAVGAGLAYGALGYSHHAVQDIACMRGFPGMLMATPGDPAEVVAVTDYLCGRYRGPCYLRLGKGGESVVAEIDRVEPGIRTISESTTASKAAVLACGNVLSLAAEAARFTRASLASVPLWWPDERMYEVCIRFVERHARVVVVEEHLPSGGFGSFIRECLERRPELQQRVRCLALRPSVCGDVGSQAYLRRAGGMTVEDIIALLRQE